jgi:hypothetical protein
MPRARFSVAVIPVLYLTNFNVKEGKMLDMQAWMKKNEGAIQKSAPKGWTYRGTYAYVLGFGRSHGATLWECANYADFDAWRNHKDATWMRLWEEMQDFLSNDPGSGQSYLMREIGDTRILEPRKPEK